MWRVTRSPYGGPHNMRSKNFGNIPNLLHSFRTEQHLSIFKKICLIRHFELNAKDAYDAKRITFPVYLSVGQETVPAALSEAFKEPSIFGQHRAHGFYLAYGGDIVALIDELLMRPTGCAKGMGGSASIHSPAIRMFGHNGLLGDQVPIAVGYALGTNNRVLSVMGDATAEEDYVLGALGYAAHKKLPILFVVVDNNLSVLTETKVRRNWDITKVAEGFDIPSVDITDDPWLIMHHVQKFSGTLPALINIQTVRHLWHFGTGVDGPPEWDRMAIVKEELRALGLAADIDRIERETKQSIDELWKKQLSTNV